jgi:hypothetical protein
MAVSELTRNFLTGSVHIKVVAKFPVHFSKIQSSGVSESAKQSPLSLSATKWSRKKKKMVNFSVLISVHLVHERVVNNSWYSGSADKDGESTVIRGVAVK